MKKLFLLVLMLSATGCYHYPEAVKFKKPQFGKISLKNLLGDKIRISPENLMFVKTAAVVSLVEQQPRIQWVGADLKQSNLESLVLDDWNAMATTTSLVEERLKQKGIAVVGINNDLSSKEAYSSSASFAEPERVRNHLLAAAAARGVDMLVVIYRQQVRDFMSDSSQKVTGYGLFKRHSDRDVYAYGVVHIEALNVERGEVMGKANAEVKVALGSDTWQQNFETDDGPFRLSPVRSTKIRDGIIKALSDASMIAAQEAGISN
ncbi:MAG: hypothetical protein O3C28_08215 [Proteobacteria bacterium]|nr:hypothetical protein [Pseudomonadota bacterium]